MKIEVLECCGGKGLTSDRGEVLNRVMKTRNAEIQFVNCGANWKFRKGMKNGSVSTDIVVL